MRGCKTYKKKSSRKGKTTNFSCKAEEDHAFKETRSFEHRSREIRSEKERKFWEDIDVDVMSEEDPCGEEYIRHPPKHRSDKLNKFITRLDERSVKRKATQPRKIRRCGSPVEVAVPENTKRWIIRKDYRNSGGHIEEDEADIVSENTSTENETDKE